MNKEWCVVQLNPKDEKIDNEIIISNFKSILGQDTEIFIPNIIKRDIRGGYKTSLFEGYVFAHQPKFVKANEYSKLESSPYVESILKDMSQKNISLVPDMEILKMRHQLQTLVPKGVAVGTMVKIEKGIFAPFTGEVKSIEGDKAVVEINTTSIKRVASIPVMFLTSI